MGAAAAHVDDGQLWKKLPRPSPHVPAVGPARKVYVGYEAVMATSGFSSSAMASARLDGLHAKSAFLQRCYAQIEDGGVVLHVQN